MCRLLATASPVPRTIAELLGPEQPAVFRDMATLHDDGWGHAWLNAHDTIVRRRFAESGLRHPGLTAALTRNVSRAQLVHLRLATHGLPCTSRNTHPFLADEMAFGHNGSLLPLDGFDGLIRSDVEVFGDTDSERYFAVIRSRIRDGMSVGEAVNDAVSTLRSRYPASSLNAVLLSVNDLIAIHAHANVPSPHGELAARTDTGSLPFAHDSRYFTMHVRRGPNNSVTLASSGMDVTGWEPLPDESVTTVHLDSMVMQTAHLGQRSD